MDHFMENDAEIYSYELKKLAGFGKDGEKGFDGAITSLMMQTYLCNCDFRKRINQKGVEYGWDVAVYSSPEHIYGYDHDTGSDRAFEYGVPSGNGYRAVSIHSKDREAGMLACEG